GRDPQLRPGGEPDQRRHHHPGLDPSADRGAPSRPGQTGQVQGRGRPRLRPQHSPQGDGGAAPNPQGRRSGRGRGQARRKGPREDDPSVRGSDRRAGQAQRRRIAGGLVAEQQADPEAGTSEPPKKPSRAGRDLPAAIAVGVVLGAIAIGVLLFKPIFWLPVLAVAMPVATYEVVRRLKEAGYSLPLIPLLLGGQAMVWLTFYGPAGPLGAYGGTI